MVGEDRIASHPSQRNNGTSVTSRRKQKWKVWATAWPHSTAIVHRPRLLSASIPSSHIHLNPVLYSTPLQHSPLSPPALRICTCLLHHFIFRITPAPSHYALPRSFYLPRLPYLQYIYPLYTLYIPPVYPAAITVLLDYRPFRQCTQSTAPKMPRTLSEAQKSGVSSSAIPYFHLPLQRSSSEAPVWRPPPPTDLVSNALSTLCIALLPLSQCFKDTNLTVVPI